MSGLLWEPDRFFVFLLLTVILGAAGAWASGRAIAQTWRPVWHVPVYMLPLSFAVRFLHYALFEGQLLSLHYWLIDFAVCLAAGLAGYRVMRVAQMVRQYSWIFTKAGAFGWQPKGP